MFHLFMATPEKMVFDGMIHSMVVPGMDGYFGVLPNHAPIIAALTAGKLVITHEDNQKTVWAVSGGVVEVSHNTATLLGDAIEAAHEINVKRSEASMAKAKKILAAHPPTLEFEAARRKLARAKNRIKIAHEKPKTH